MPDCARHARPGRESGRGTEDPSLATADRCQDCGVSGLDITPAEASRGGTVRDADLPMLAALWLTQGSIHRCCASWPGSPGIRPLKLDGCSRRYSPNLGTRSLSSSFRTTSFPGVVTGIRSGGRWNRWIQHTLRTPPPSVSSKLLEMSTVCGSRPRSSAHDPVATMGRRSGPAGRADRTRQSPLAVPAEE
jgi:hypothetical protein